jgi:hypothetical protein
LRKQADLEKWSDEQFITAVSEEIKGFVAGVDQVSDRNRERSAFLRGTEAKQLLFESEIEAMDIRTDRTKEAWLATYDKLEYEDDYAGQLMMIEVAQSGDGIQLFEDAEFQQMKRIVEGKVMADDLMVGYRAAKVEGKVDEHLLMMEQMDLDDETWSAFNEKRSSYDDATALVQKQIDTAQQLHYEKFLHSVDANTDIDSYINTHDLNSGQISKLYTAKNRSSDSAEFMANPFRDNKSAEVRKAANSAINTDQPVEDVMRDSVLFSAQYGTSPELYSNILNNYGSMDDAATLRQAGDSYIAYNETADAPLPLWDRTRAKLEYYSNRVESKVDPQVAAEATNRIFADRNDQKIQASRNSWENPLYGSENNKSPAEIIGEKQVKILSDPDNPIGQLFIADYGEGWFNVMDKYEDIQVSPLMEQELRENAHTFWLATDSEDVAINGSLRSARAKGYAGTDINYDVRRTAGLSEGKSLQIQLNPITKVGDTIIPRQVVRQAIGKDITDVKMVPVFMPEGTEPKTYSMDELEIGDGVIAEFGPNKGRLQWSLKANGSPLQYSNGEPVFWYYPIKERKPEVPTDEKKAAKVVNQQIKERISNPARSTVVDLPGFN